MQVVLCVDISGKIARAELVEVDGRTLRVLKKATVSALPFHQLLGAASKGIDAALEASDKSVSSTSEAHSVESSSVESSSVESSSVESSSVEASGIGDSKQTTENIVNTTATTEGMTSAPQLAPEVQAAALALESLTSQFLGEWSACILLAHIPGSLSLEVSLPPLPVKRLEKVLQLEVQDGLPFELDDFHLTYRRISSKRATLQGSSNDNKNSDDAFPYFVSLTPRLEIQKLLAACSYAKIDPLVVMPPHVVLSALSYIGPEYFASNAALLVARDPRYHLAVCIGGEVRAERIIHRHNVVPGGEIDEASVKKELLTDLRVSIAAWEHQFGVTLDKIYLVDEQSLPHLFQSLGRPVEQVDFSMIARSANQETSSSLASLAAVYVQDLNPPPAPINLRAREFAYRPKLRDLLHGVGAIIPYVAVAAMLVLLTLGAVYYTRDRFLTQNKEIVASRIRTTLTGVDVPQDFELDALKGEVRRLQTQLKDLGSFSHSSPLDAFVEFSQNVTLAPRVTVKTVNVSGSRIRLQGLTPEYKPIEDLEKTLKARKDLYARVKSDVAGNASGPNGRSFTLDLFLKE